MMKYIFKNSRGSALLAVMLVIAMVSIIGLGLLAAAFNNVRQASNTREFEKSYYDAENDLSKEVEALRLAVSAEYDSLLYYKQNDEATYDSKFSTFYDDIKTGVTDRMSKTASTGVDYSVTYTIYNSGDIGNEYAVYTLRVDTAKTSMNRFVDTTMDVKRLHIVTNSSWDSEDVLYVDGNVWNNSSKYDVGINSGAVAMPSDASSAEKQSVIDNLNVSKIKTVDIQPWVIDFDKAIKAITDSGIPCNTYSSTATLDTKSGDLSNKTIVVKGNLTLNAAQINGATIICTGNVTVGDYSKTNNALDGVKIFAAGNVSFTTNTYQGFADNYKYGIFVYTGNAFFDDDNAQSWHILPLVLYSSKSANFTSKTVEYIGQIIAQNSVTFDQQKDTSLDLNTDMVKNFYSNLPDYIPKPDFSDSTSSEESYSIPSGIISGSGKITETTK